MSMRAGKSNRSKIASLLKSIMITKPSHSKQSLEEKKYQNTPCSSLFVFFVFLGDGIMSACRSVTSHGELGGGIRSACRNMVLHCYELQCFFFF